MKRYLYKCIFWLSRQKMQNTNVKNQIIFNQNEKLADRDERGMHESEII
jgi:hypothetical protein